MQIAATEPESCWFIFNDEKMLVHKADHYQVLPRDCAVALQDLLTHFHPLGTYNDKPCYCAQLEGAPEPLAQVEFLSLRKSLEVLGWDWYQAVTKAHSVNNWDRNHQYCGHCGHATRHTTPGLFERVCTRCHLLFYPRISPSIIVLIQRGDELVMARSPHFSTGSYGLIAGFVEAGENLEQAVHREVKEEVNLEVTNLRYFGSQPWPFPDSLMVAFIADYAGGQLRIDHKEIEAAGWYKYNNLPGIPSSSVGIARKLVNYFIQEREAANS